MRLLVVTSKTFLSMKIQLPFVDSFTEGLNLFETIHIEEKRSLDFQLLKAQIIAVCESEKNIITNLSNIGAILNASLSAINWVGFYFYDKTEKNLMLGPFQGKLACTRISIGSGVCGTAYKTKKTQRIADVHQFPGHIACDVQSKSELVIPFAIPSLISGVLDIDSPELDRFSKSDQEGMEMIVSELEEILKDNNLLQN
jgi:L-methionine (R)-S-oxide reductase